MTMKEIPRSLNGSDLDRSYTEIIIVFECDDCGKVWEPLSDMHCGCPNGKGPAEWTVAYRTIADVFRHILPSCVALL